MRVAHADRCDFILYTVDRLSLADLCFGIFTHNGNKLRLKLRRSHIYSDFGNAVAFGDKFQHLDAGEGLQCDSGFSRQSFLVHIFSDASGGVAAHLGLRAVGIEHPHSEISYVTGENHHKSVRSYSKMGVAYFDGQFTQVIGNGLKTIEINIIISGTVHL